MKTFAVLCAMKMVGVTVDCQRLLGRQRETSRCSWRSLSGALADYCGSSLTGVARGVVVVETTKERRYYFRRYYFTGDAVEDDDGRWSAWLVEVP